MSFPGGANSRKRVATSPSASERSTKRSKLSVKDEDVLDDSSERRPQLKKHTRFPLPSNPQELTESNLAAVLNEEENPDPDSVNTPRIRRLSNFTFFYADTTRTDGFRDIVGLDKLQRRGGPNNGRTISAHGGARMDDADLDEAAYEGGVDGEDNPENPGPAPLQFDYCEVILDSIEAWWIGDGVSNAYVLPVCLPPTLTSLERDVYSNGICLVPTRRTIRALWQDVCSILDPPPLVSGYRRLRSQASGQNL